MPEVLDGLLTFFASHHAIRAEKVLHGQGLATHLVPGPKELSPNCGVALRFAYDQKDQVLAALGDSHVQVDEVHRFVPQSDSRPKPGRARLLWRSRR